MSEEINGEVHIDEQDASGGRKTGTVRWVLAISLLSAILIMSIIWISGAVMSDDSDDVAAPEYIQE